MRACDTFQSFPSIILVLAMVSLLGPSVWNIIWVIGGLGWASVARLVYSGTLSTKQTGYVEASRALGATDRAILFRTLLPNVIAPVWAALPLLARGWPVPVYLLADTAAAAGMLALVAALTNGWGWFARLALPILGITTLLGAVVGGMAARRCSGLSTAGVFFLLLILWLLALEALIDLYAFGRYQPGWSVIAAAAGLVAAVFLLIVRLRPRLREELGRRFHT